MKKAALTACCFLSVSLFAILAARDHGVNVPVTIELIDADTNQEIGGIIRIFPLNTTEPVHLPDLVDRLQGIRKTESVKGWYVVPAQGARTKLPPGDYRIEALSGLETILASQEVEITDSGKKIRVGLSALFQPEQSGLVAGNTHLHLRGMSRKKSDEYLAQIPAADGIQVLFISYLERAGATPSYITNRYPIGNLADFKSTDVLFNNGEEHRHNFEGYGQGYGHVMLLDIRKLITPVSIGPGITRRGFDYPALRAGIDNARQQGGTVIWCHNTYGHEDVPNALSGRLDALNIFDGSRNDSYEENYYRYLNIGMKMPISTGTDWFIFDFSRVYAQIKGQLSIKSWLDALKSGRNSITNGPLLSLGVNGQQPGATLELDKPKQLQVRASAIGRHNFQKLQLVHNGKIIHSMSARKQDKGYAAEINRAVAIDGPGWFALRIKSDQRNELDQKLYAHTSPVYVEIAGGRRFDIDAAQALVKQMELGREDIRAKGIFRDHASREKVLAIYDEGIQDLLGLIERRTR